MLDSLRQITQEVNLASSMQEALHIVVEEVCKVLDVEYCTVFLADYSTEQLTMMATRGLNENAIGELKIGFHEGVIGLVAQREEPINLDDARKHPNFLYLPSAGEETLRSFLGVPIIHRRKVLGVLSIQQKKPRKFSENEETFLITLSAQIAGLIASAESRLVVTDPGKIAEGKINKLKGMAAASGIAVGHAMVFYPPADLESIPDRRSRSCSAELKRFKKALSKAQQDVAEMKARLEQTLSSEELKLFDAYLLILGEHGLGQEVEVEIANGHWAPGALRRVVEHHLRRFENMDGGYLRERATDLKDLARRILIYLEDDVRARPQLNQPCIVIAEEITASMLAELPSEKILGVVSINGSPTSHTAILAKALGIPAIVGLTDFPINHFESQELIIDGYNGDLFINPSETLKQSYESLIREERLYTKELEKDLHEPAETKDGHRVSLLVNTGLLADFEQSKNIGAEGVGLYRTEIPFILRERFPSESEQIRIYRAALNAFKGKPISFRTLDIGGDKQLPYFPIVEENPFLGWRGIRVTLDHPEIFLLQIRSIIKASTKHDQYSIALPMISTIEELNESLRLIQQAFYEVKEELVLDDLAFPQIGIILEVPSIIYQLPAVLKKIDFISIGTNDLIQYLLAVDRNNSRVSSLYSSLHPAIVAALADIQYKCRESNVPVNVCGEMAGDPLSAILLLGLGFNGLSMNARSLPKIKKVIRSFTLKEAEDIVARVLTLESEKDIHSLLLDVMETKNLGGLVRAGK